MRKLLVATGLFVCITSIGALTQTSVVSADSFCSWNSVSDTCVDNNGTCAANGTGFQCGVVPGPVKDCVCSKQSDPPPDGR